MQLIDRLQKAGMNILHGKHLALKNQFCLACQEVYVEAETESFVIPFGDQDLLRAVFEKLLKNSFHGKKTAGFKEKISPNDSPETYFNEINKKKLFGLLKKTWPEKEVDFPSPETFSVKEVQKLKWLIECHKCSTEISIQLTEGNSSVTFNKNNFTRHIKTHSRSDEITAKRARLEEAHEAVNEDQYEPKIFEINSKSDPEFGQSTKSVSIRPENSKTVPEIPNLNSSNNSFGSRSSLVNMQPALSGGNKVIISTFKKPLGNIVNFQSLQQIKTENPLLLTPYKERVLFTKKPDVKQKENPVDLPIHVI